MEKYNQMSIEEPLELEPTSKNGRFSRTIKSIILEKVLPWFVISNTLVGALPAALLGRETCERIEVIGFQDYPGSPENKKLDRFSIAYDLLVNKNCWAGRHMVYALENKLDKLAKR